MTVEYKLDCLNAEGQFFHSVASAATFFVSKAELERNNCRITHIQPIRRFVREDFEIKEIETRVYGDENYVLVFAQVINKVTGMIFKDWVRPVQLISINELNNLIFWE
jgi:hypothetical protein